LPRSPACNAGPLAMTDWLSRLPYFVIARSRTEGEVTKQSSLWTVEVYFYMSEITASVAVLLPSLASLGIN